jgi:hypothetical protein
MRRDCAGEMSDKVVEAELEKKHNTFVWEVEVGREQVMEVHHRR